jgi:hypothetical protein
VSQVSGVKIADARRLLVERVAASPYFNRSARLRDLLHYLTERVLEDESCEIREHEVGHKLFGRALDYDTMADNIVRVHASMLRKRLEQYFAAEGIDEPWVIEIPKGNYAPVFHSRPSAISLPAIAPPEITIPEPSLPSRPSRLGLWLLAATAAFFACTTLWLLLHPAAPKSETPNRPAVRQFWSSVFSPDRPTDVVLDDAAVALYQELTGKPIALSEYFDRSYLRSLGASGGLTAEAASTLALRRQSSFSSASFYWKLT